MRSCYDDTDGYKAILDLTTRLDYNDDSSIDTGEAVAYLGENSFKELNGGHRSMNTVLDYTGHTDVQDIWHRWTSTEGIILIIFYNI